MTYITKQPSSLGAITDIATAAKSVVEDPCLGAVTALMLRLNQLEQAPLIPIKTGVPQPPPPPVKGIGLCKAVTPLKAVVYVRERPWILPLGVIGVVGALVGTGYLLGKRTRR